MDERRKNYSVAYENVKNGGLYFSLLVFFVIAVNLAFSLIITSLSGGDAERLEVLTSTNVYKYFSFSLSAVVAMVLSFLFCKIYGKNLLEECKIKSDIKGRKAGVILLYSLLLFVGMTFGLSGLNGYFVEFLSENFGYSYKSPTLPTGGAGVYILNVLTVCVLPAIAEETAFRGIMLSSLRGAGKWGVAVLNGLLFSLYHMSPAQTPYQFAVGFSFALIALSSGSVIPSVAIHFLNNYIIITFQFFGVSFDFGQVLNLILTVVGGASFILFIILVALRENPISKGDLATKWTLLRRFLLFSAVGILSSLAVWIANFAV